MHRYCYFGLELDAGSPYSDLASPVGHCIWSSIDDRALLTLSAFLTSSAVTYGYSPYSRKLGHWWSRKNLFHAGTFALPVLGQSFEIRKYRCDASRREERYGVLEILVEVGVEDALIHEVRSPLISNKHPTQVMQFERRKDVRIGSHRFLDRLAVLTNALPPCRA